MRGDACVDSSAYLEATPSAAVVEEIKPDDKVTQVVQPEKPVEPSGIEEEKEEEEEEVREREGMGTAQHEAVKVLGHLHKKLQKWKVRCWMWRGVRRGVRRRNQRPRRNRRRRGMNYWTLILMHFNKINFTVELYTALLWPPIQWS